MDALLALSQLAGALQSQSVEQQALQQQQTQPQTFGLMQPAPPLPLALQQQALQQHALLLPAQSLTRPLKQQRGSSARVPLILAADAPPPHVSLPRKRKQRTRSAVDSGGRGKYKCSRCGLPKVGHECKYGIASKAAASQCELRVTVQNKMPRTFLRVVVPNRAEAAETETVALTVTPEASPLHCSVSAAVLVPDLQAGRPGVSPVLVPSASLVAKLRARK